MSLDFLRNVHAPEFPEGLDWIGSEPLRLADLRGSFRPQRATALSTTLPSTASVWSPSSAAAA